MGFFERFFGKSGVPQHAGDDSVGRLEEGDEYGAVGESFYASAFRAISKRLHAREGQEVFLDLELQLDPENPFSHSGKAVKVVALGEHVGHISENAAEAFFDKISERGDRAKCRGRIWFDSFTADNPRHSVSLFVGFPVRFEGEPDPLLGWRSSTYSALPESRKAVLDEEREVRKRGISPPLPPLQKGDEVGVVNLFTLDEELLAKSLRTKGIELVHGITKSRTSLVVVNAPGDWDTYLGLDKALLWDKPHIYFQDFFEKYPDLRPPDDLLFAWEKGSKWLRENDGLELHENASKAIARAAREKPIVLQGLAISENFPYRFGLYDCRVLSQHRKAIKTIMVDAGAAVWDRLVTDGHVDLVDEGKTAHVIVSGQVISSLYADDRDWFRWAIDYHKGNQILAEIWWLDDDRFAVSIQSDFGAVGES